MSALVIWSGTGASSALMDPKGLSTNDNFAQSETESKLTHFGSDINILM